MYAAIGKSMECNEIIENLRKLYFKDEKKGDENIILFCALAKLFTEVSFKIRIVYLKIEHL